MRGMYRDWVIAGVGILVIGAALWWGSTIERNAGGSDTPVIGTYEDSVYGYAFSYRGGADGYVVLEPDGASAHPDHLKTVVLMEKREYDALLASTDAREGPPTINISIYRNSENMWSGQWAAAHPSESNVGLAVAEPEEGTFAGANAVRYLVDGLYPTDTIVVAHGGFVYILSGSYLDATSAIRQDFEPFLNSFAFIPTN